jgi:hypothetical protein
MMRNQGRNHLRTLLEARGRISCKGFTGYQDNGHPERRLFASISSQMIIAKYKGDSSAVSLMLTHKATLYNFSNRIEQFPSCSMFHNIYQITRHILNLGGFFMSIIPEEHSYIL